jgi:hypothetical protein
MGAGGVDMSVAMQMKRLRPSAVLFISLTLLACSDGKGSGTTPQMTDAGDSIPVDAGVRALCPLGAQATCQSAMECGDLRDPPTNCAGCIPYNRSMCQLGQCVTPEPLTSGDPINYLFKVGSLSGTVQSFAGIVMSAESAGGQAWTCNDVYSKNLDLTSMCHNILDTRGQNIAQPDDQYTLTFTRFASNQTSLFIVYGYTDLGSEGTPVGVSCKEYEIGSPGIGLVMIPGDQMKRL